MSQVANHVKYCLNKAKRELEEGKKHKGLVEINPDLKKATTHLEKAQHNFRAISAFAKIGFSDWSVSAAFYSIYHCFLAILVKHGYDSRNQDCTFAAIRYLKEQGKLKLDNRFIESLKSHADAEEQHAHSAVDLRELREDFQYGVNVEYKTGALEQLQKICSELIDATKDEIYISK